MTLRMTSSARMVGLRDRMGRGLGRKEAAKHGCDKTGGEEEEEGTEEGDYLDQ